MVETSTQDWFDAKKEELADEVFRTCNFIKTQNEYQRRMFLHYLELYSDGAHNRLGTRGNGFSGLANYYSATRPNAVGGSRFNLCAAVVDTASSLVSQSPPLPIYITSGDDLKVVRIAEKRTKVLQSQINKLSKGVFSEAFDFCAQVGTGCVHGFLDEKGLPCLEAVHPLEILVEYLDGLYRQPRSIHRTKYVSKSHLSKLYPSKAEIIQKSGKGKVDRVSDRMMPDILCDHTNIVEVIESWHLGYNGKPGRHTLCVTAGSLKDEPFEDSEFPFAFTRLYNRDRGFWGIGLIERAHSAQNRINELIIKVERAQNLASTLIVFNPNSGEGTEPAVNPDNLKTTKLGLVIPYDPQVGKPELGKWDGTLNDLQQQINLEYERVLLVNGMSDAQVSGEGAGKGLTSGVAVRAADDVQSRRLYHPTARFEDMCLVASELVERLNDRLAANDTSYAPTGYLSAAGQNFLVTSNWSELVLEDGQACINMMKMSALPTTPQGKWAAIQEWIQAGFIQKPAAMKLLEFPALDEYAGLETAAFDLVIKQITDLLDGLSVVPLPRQSMTLILDLGTKAWNRMMMMNPSEEVIDAFENYLNTAQANIDAIAAKQTPQEPMAAPAAPELPQGGISAAPVAAPAIAA